MHMGGMVEGFEHFLIASRWPVSPAEVLDWPEELVRDALQVIAAEGRAEERNRGRNK